MTMIDLNDDSDVSLDSLSRVWVETRHAVEGFAALDALLSEGATQHHAWGTALIGPPRTGKTMLITEYLRSCQESEEGRRPLKYLYVELGADAKPSTIATQTLENMGDPKPSYGRPNERTNRVIEGIKRRKYDLIIYDEAHFLVNSETKKVQEDGVAWFNTLLNRGRCPVILIGSERLELVMTRHVNTSLAGRLLPFPKFRKYDVFNSDDVSEFQYVLARIEADLGMPTQSKLTEPATAIRICLACDGRLGLLEGFLTRARQIARQKRYSCLMPDVLAQTAREVAPLWGLGPDNPFEEKNLDVLMERMMRATSSNMKRKM